MIVSEGDLDQVIGGFGMGKKRLHPHLPRPVKLQEISAGKAIS
jgi:hypothetical protein